MTREEFKERMQFIAENPNYDPEYRHHAADNIMCEALRDFGYEDGIDIFEKMPKWYA